MPKKTLLGVGVAALSLGAVLSLGSTLVWGATDGNTNNANANANTSIATVQRPRGDFNNDGVSDLTRDARSLAAMADYLGAFSCIRCTNPADRLPKHAVSCGPAADVDGNGVANVQDAIYALNHTYGNGPGPVGSATVVCPKPTPTPTPKVTPSP